MNTFYLLLLVGIALATSPMPPPHKIDVYEASETAATSPIGIEGIVNSPIMALIKRPRGLTAYVLEHGLTTLATSPAPTIRNLKALLRASNENIALVIHPTILAAENTPIWQQIRGEPIIRIEAPENTLVAGLAKISLNELPYVFFFKNSDFASRHYNQVVKHGDIDLYSLISPFPFTSGIDNALVNGAHDFAHAATSSGLPSAKFPLGNEQNAQTAEYAHASVPTGYAPAVAVEYMSAITAGQDFSKSSSAQAPGDAPSFGYSAALKTPAASLNSDSGPALTSDASNTATQYRPAYNEHGYGPPLGYSGVAKSTAPAAAMGSADSPLANEPSPALGYTESVKSPTVSPVSEVETDAAVSSVIVHIPDYAVPAFGPSGSSGIAKSPAVAPLSLASALPVKGVASHSATLTAPYRHTPTTENVEVSKSPALATFDAAHIVASPSAETQYESSFGHFTPAKSPAPAGTGTEYGSSATAGYTLVDGYSKDAINPAPAPMTQALVPIKSGATSFSKSSVEYDLLPPPGSAPAGIAAGFSSAVKGPEGPAFAAPAPAALPSPWSAPAGFGTAMEFGHA